MRPPPTDETRSFIGEVNTRGPEVLLVEDDREAAVRHAEWLRDEFTVEIEDDEVAMPERLSGTEGAVLHVRANPPTDPAFEAGSEGRAELPRGLITDEEARCYQAETQFDGYLERPVDEAELRAFVGRIWRRVAYRDLIREEFTIASALGAAFSRSDRSDPSEFDEYQWLQQRKGEIRAQIRALEDHFDCSDFIALIRREFGSPQTATAT